MKSTNSTRYISAKWSDKGSAIYFFLTKSISSSKSLFQIIAKCERVNHWICLRSKLIGEINISIHVHLTA